MIKVVRSFPAPASLAIEKEKTNGNYNEADVIEQLKKDFSDKCYICGIKGLQDPEVEHLLPHKQGLYKDRKFDWENLFWSCGHCNSIKNKNEYDEKILNCCKIDPEDKLNFCIKANEVEISSKTSKEIDIKTAKLITEAFNLKNTGLRVHKSDLRFKELQKEMNVLYDVLEKYKKNPSSKITLKKLKVLLARESIFSSFKRDYIRNQFSNLIDYLI